MKRFEYNDNSKQKRNADFRDLKRQCYKKKSNAKELGKTTFARSNKNGWMGNSKFDTKLCSEKFVAKTKLLKTMYVKSSTDDKMLLFKCVSDKTIYFTNEDFDKGK